MAKKQAKQSLDPKIEVVVKRLHVSALAEAAEVRENGEVAGIEWAEKYATTRELKKLAQASYENYIQDNDDAFAVFLRIISSDQDIFDFWSGSNLGGASLSDYVDCASTYVEGFVQGALMVWNTASPHV